MFGRDCAKGCAKEGVDMKELRVPLVKYGPRNRSTVDRHDRITGTETRRESGEDKRGFGEFFKREW
jgi:hypothetical protein